MAISIPNSLHGQYLPRRRAILVPAGSSSRIFYGANATARRPRLRRIRPAQGPDRSPDSRQQSLLAPNKRHQTVNGEKKSAQELRGRRKPRDAGLGDSLDGGPTASAGVDGQSAGSDRRLKHYAVMGRATTSAPRRWRTHE